MRLFFAIMLGLGLLASAFSCSLARRDNVKAQSSEPAQQEIQVTVPGRVVNYTYEIVNTFPHDSSAFTQGLVFYQGVLYESTGLNGASSLRKVELETGRVLKKLDIPAQYFAEGLVLFNGRLLQLTWQNQMGFIYDLETFQQLGTFSYDFTDRLDEGWGLTHDSHSLIMSDGTSQIRFLDPNNFQVQRSINVTDHGRDVIRLNELEYVNGEIFANIWFSDRIARINPQTGAVNGWIDLTGLLPSQTSNGNVLNGIAYDAAANRLFVTGKLWPNLFEIRLKLKQNEPRR